jgi:hypothetical protein
MKKIHANSLYKRKYAKDLLNGIRKDGKSIEEVCAVWGVSDDAYHNWRKIHPEFEEAHKVGDSHKRAWWYQIQRKVASGEQTGNAAVINFALKNEAGYVDKQEVHTTHEEQIRTIKIEMLPSREDLSRRVIEGEILEEGRSQNKLDQKPS